MTIWYIGPSGSDTTGNGTSGNPYATVSKCITVGTDGDTIKALTGTYTISSTTNITKQVTITSNSGVNTDVTFNANCIIFNLQNSNINISYITLQTSSVNELITIDRNSTGSTVPTFYTGNNISNCNIKYVTYGLALNGTFIVNSNTFTRVSGTSIATIIRVYSSRGSCSISSNTFTDSNPVQYIISLTSTGSGLYFDMCNSKGGSLTIANNTLTYTSSLITTIFIFQNYFNQYVYVTSPNINYNPNTRISLVVNNNNLSFNIYGYLFCINTVSNSDYNTFGSCNINTNTINNTNYGFIHLGKNITNHNIVTISSSDLNRSIFKIYSNISDTLLTYISWNALWSSSMKKSDGNDATVGDTVTSWVPNVNSDTMTTQLLGTGSCVKFIDAKGRPCISKANSNVLMVPDINLSTVNVTIFTVFASSTVITPDYFYRKGTTGITPSAGSTSLTINGNPIKVYVAQYYTSTNFVFQDFGTFNTNINIVAFQYYNDSGTTFSLKYRSTFLDNVIHQTSSTTGQLTNVGNLEYFTIGGLTAKSGNSIIYSSGCPMYLYEIVISTGILTDSQINTKFNELYTKWITNYP